jgi:hypothetical protein
MKRTCECGGRIHVHFSKRSGGNGRNLAKENWDDHTLCQKCYRSLVAQTVARLKGPKPWWVAGTIIRRLLAHAEGG